MVALADMAYAGGKISRITTSGIITEYDASTTDSNLVKLAISPRHMIWFNELAGNKAGKLTMAPRAVYGVANGH